MLDRAGNADGDIELGRHHLPGLADLEVVGPVSGVHRRARGADRGAETVGDFLHQMEILRGLHAAPARDHDPRPGELGTLGPGKLLTQESRQRLPAAGGDRLDRGASALGGRGKGGAAHGHHLDRIARPDGRHRVAGIDRAHENVRRDHLGDVGDLGDVEQRRHPRGEVLARSIGGEQDLRILGRESHHQRRHRLGEQMVVGRVVGMPDTRDAGDPCGRLGDRRGPAAGHQNVDIAGERGGGGDGVERRRVERRAVMGGDDKSRHQITPASFLSLSTSSSTSATLRPPARAGGSSTVKVSSRGATSTPSSSTAIWSIGFFFAFMMLGSDA